MKGLIFKDFVNIKSQLRCRLFCSGDGERGD